MQNAEGKFKIISSGTLVLHFDYIFLYVLGDLCGERFLPLS